MLGDDRFNPMDELNIRGGDMDCTKAARFLPELVFTGTEPSPSDSEFDDPTARFTRGGDDGAAKNEVDDADRPVNKTRRQSNCLYESQNKLTVLRLGSPGGV